MAPPTTTVADTAKPRESNPRASVQLPASPPAFLSAQHTRMFGRNGTYTAQRRASIAHKPTVIERAQVSQSFMNPSAALRLSKRAELLDKSLNVHMRSAADRHPEDSMLPELEGNTPIIAELEGSAPVLPELEGSMPTTGYSAVEARRVPASAIKKVETKAKRASLRFLSTFRPDKSNYQVACTNAAAEIAQADREAADKRFFVDRLNTCRKVEGFAPLTMDDELSTHAQQHADNLPPHTPVASNGVVPTPANWRYSQSVILPAGARPDTVTTIKSPHDPRQFAARVISERGLGAMACVERWYSGKHRKHQFKEINRERHQADCPCRLHIVFETVMSAAFTKVGVGRATEGAGVWVVELAA